MNDITLVVLCAGESSRFELSVKKQWIRLDDEPLWLNVSRRLSSYSNFQQTIVIGHKNELSYMENFSEDFLFVTGGETRQQSIVNALTHVTSKYVMITDVARCCVPQSVIMNLITHKNDASIIVPILKISDTVVYEDNTINRDNVKIVQTPQLSQTNILKKATLSSTEFTDDSSAIKSIGGSVKYIAGSDKSIKITFGEEMDQLTCLKQANSNTFLGNGIDIHVFEKNKKMVLGGVEIESKFGFKAHSDGDVLIHSVIDSLLGACGAGDIGEFFPDTDPQYKGADSKDLLKHIVKFITNVGYEIINVDLTILAEIPKINPHKKAIRSTMAKLLNIETQKINIKATTAEKMSFVGREEGVVVLSSATLKYYDWTKK
ncbi:bifunctional 2-C-methyl-D-erythritol 4-phosphate cytidylyltransferase/2-C-methyl-D-erythritol 2,4-cyclodiphosphate synthase [Arcobacteraceae bacterium]|nr:bifunctional 2-C-methyl-D-erythritol 4-phosphate cytidylyltransferase/2-C-methyl-D-erythritol 2,4-cyclodiphosphate synthase [Arcobacteraceae bacterium]